MIEGWKIKSIKDFAKTASGGTPSRTRKDFYDGNILWVKSGELNDNFIDDTEEKITEEALRMSSAKLFPVGTILIAMYGATVGKTAILKKPASTNQAVCGIFPDEDNFNNQFLRFQLMFKREDFLKQRYGGAQPNISQTIIKTFDILLPPLPEQRKIAYVLSTVQKAIEQQDKLIHITTELKKALMQKLFTKGTKGEKLKQTEIGWVPESWEVVTIESLFDIQQGKQVSKSNRFGTNQKPFLRTANVFWGYIDFTELDEMHFSDEEESKFTLKRDDLLVCEGGDVGRTAIWEYDKQEIYYQNHLHRLRRKKDDIIPKYFMYWMSFIVQETSYVKDAGNRTTIPNLSKSRLGSLYFPKPGIQYQEKVVSILQGLDNKINFLQKKKQTLTSLFKTLLHELMTGQRRVHEIDFENECHKVRNKKEEMLLAAEPNIKYKK
jgi:type I restriction enzyme S subunit